MDETGAQESSARVYVRRFGPFPEISPPVFLLSAGIILTLIFFSGLFTELADSVFSSVQTWISVSFGWFYMLAVSFFLGFVLWLGFSRWGHVRLGDPFERPRFGLLGWFAMLFSAGMGIGLLFWSVAEPMYHYIDPPTGGESSAAEAMRFTFLHWGLHAWGIYCVAGLAIGYFAYRQKLPLTIRSAFYPVLGDRIYGPIGHAIDIIAVVGTLLGVATSLGLGVLQINAGLNFLTGVPQNEGVQVAIIAGVTLIATLSVVAGLSRGIQRLSKLNIILSILLMIFLWLVGPTRFLTGFIVESTGDYLQNLIALSLWNDAIGQTGWQEAWTVFYWGWWISWAPFVGMFVARVSRGRTIREFVLGVLLAPTLATFVWMGVFGGNALHLEIFGGVAIGEAVQENVSTALFVMLENLPLQLITASVATLIVLTYFVTSSDSGSLVIDMLTAGGHTEPPTVQRVFWAVTEGVLAAVLLVAGGLGALQAAAIAAGLPFSVVMLGMCYCLVRGLQKYEPIAPKPKQVEPRAPKETMGDMDHAEEDLPERMTPTE